MRRARLILVGIILLGLLLRLFLLTQRGSLWFDEAFSVHFAAMDFSRLLAYLRFENNPPLYFILLHFWMQIAGDGDFAVRLLSLGFGLLATPLIFWIGKQLHSATAGLFAAFLLTISSLQIFYATETRMYALFLFLTLATVSLVIKDQRKRKFLVGRFSAIAENLPQKMKGKISQLWLVTLLILLVWTHITAGLLWAAYLVYLIWEARGRLRILFVQQFSFFLVSTGALFSLAPWLWTFIRLKITAPLAQGYFFYLPPEKNYFLSLLETFLVFSNENAFVVTLLSVFIVGLLVFAMRPLDQKVRLLLCWLTVPLLAGFAFQNAVPRYFIAASPAFYLLLGIGYAKLTQKVTPFLVKKQVFSFHVSFFLLVFTLVATDYPGLVQAGQHHWDKVAAWIARLQNEKCKMKNDCLVLINPHSEVLPFERYYQGDLPVVGFYPMEDKDDRDLRIVKTNWRSLVTPKNLDKLTELTALPQRVFLVSGGTEPIGRNLVVSWFWDQGWRREQARDFGRISVMELKR